jgi:small subunit ribosomal protein S17
MARARKKPDEQAPETQAGVPVAEEPAPSDEPDEQPEEAAAPEPDEPATEESVEETPSPPETAPEEPVDEPAEEPIGAGLAPPETPAKPAKKAAAKRAAKPRAEKTEKPKAAARKLRAAAKRTAERKPIVRLPRAERPRGKVRERRGVVVSDGMEKTIVVRVDTVRPDRSYRKVVRRSRKLHAHDERNEAKVGDLVRIVETRPISKTKSWRLAEVIEAAK